MMGTLLGFFLGLVIGGLGMAFWKSGSYKD